MHFKGLIYDPYTSEFEEWEDYYLFISRIREVALLEIDESNPEEEENTYLWVKIILSDSEDDIDEVKAPYFRLNKLLFSEIFAEGKHPDKPGKLHPRELLDKDTLERIYPDRNKGSLYITAIANFYLVDSEEAQLADVDQNNGAKEDKEFILEESDIRYPTDHAFNCELSAKSLKQALNHLQEMLELENGPTLIKQTSYKQALVIVCFFLAEAARFQLIQFAAMNMLDYDDKTNADYGLWNVWKPIILNWSAISDHLEKAGQRRLDPKLLLGIPIFIRNRVQNSPIFGNADIVNVLESYLHNPNNIQDSVINDFSIHYPEIYFSEEVIPVRNSDDEHYLHLYALRQFSLNQIDDMKDEAKSLFLDGKYQAALDIYFRALKLYEKDQLFDENQEISLKYNIGFTYYQLKQYERAIQYLENALEAVWTDHKEESLRIEKLINTCRTKVHSTTQASLKNEDARQAHLGSQPIPQEAPPPAVGSAVPTNG